MTSPRAAWGFLVALLLWVGCTAPIGSPNPAEWAVSSAARGAQIAELTIRFTQEQQMSGAWLANRESVPPRVFFSIQYLEPEERAVIEARLAAQGWEPFEEGLFDEERISIIVDLGPPDLISSLFLGEDPFEEESPVFFYLSISEQLPGRRYPSSGVYAAVWQDRPEANDDHFMWSSCGN